MWQTTFVAGLKRTFLIHCLELCWFEYLVLHDESFVLWEQHKYSNYNADADNFIKVWAGRSRGLGRTLMRDSLPNSLTRIASFLWARFQSHGWCVLLVYILVVHFRLHSVFATLLDKMGLGFLTDAVESVAGLFNSSETSLEDLPDLIDDDREEVVGRVGERGRRDCGGRDGKKNKKNKKNKKDGHSHSSSSSGTNRSSETGTTKQIEIPTKRRKPDTWLTYDKELGVVPLGVVRNWDKAKEKKRKESNIRTWQTSGDDGSSSSSAATSEERRTIPPVRGVRGEVNPMEWVD